MRAWCGKAVMLVLALLMSAAALMPGASAWEIEQQARNDLMENATACVTLQKYEKKADGTLTATAVPGAVFRLYTGDGTLIGGPYATDLSGQIQTLLPPGNYYFEETTLPDGYIFDYDTNGAPVKQYPFTVSEQDTELTVTAYNRKDAYEALKVRLPRISKVVEGKDAPEETFTFVLKGKKGCPMPEDTSGRTWKTRRTGAGTVSLGSVTFTEPGVYTYTVYEADGGDYNWEYDTAEYTITFYVTAEENRLLCDYKIKKDGKACDKILFTNIYNKINLDKTITISGRKTWIHGSDPQENWPDSIIVKIYADGELVQQRRVTEHTDWEYSFTLPKYNADGKKIKYTVDEDPVEDYAKQISGYDMVNTYTGDVAGGDPVSPMVPIGPETSANPMVPLEPETSANPMTPLEPETSASPMTPIEPTVSPAGPSDNSGNGTTVSPPKTGDEFPLTLWLIMGAVGLLGFAAMLVALRRTKHTRQGKRLKKKHGKDV